MKLKSAALLATVLVLGVEVPAQAHVPHHGHHHAHLTRHFGGHHHVSRYHGSGGGLSGRATWYGPGFQGHRTASGERFNTEGLTAAHPSLPLGCHVLVTNRVNGRSVVVRINDRGPFGGGVIDLSRASARAIGMSGSAPVSLSRL